MKFGGVGVGGLLFFVWNEAEVGLLPCLMSIIWEVMRV